MGIDTPMQIAGLIGFFLITAVLLYFLVRPFRGNGPAPSFSARIPLPIFFFLPCALTLSFLIYQALVSGEAYCLGFRNACKESSTYSLSSDPEMYWVLVTGFYILGAFFWAAGIAGLIGPKPWRKA